jgi:hypothetical protein
MHEERIPKVLNMKVNIKWPGGRLRSRWEKRLTKYGAQRDILLKKLRRRYGGKAEIGREWFCYQMTHLGRRRSLYDPWFGL